MDAIELEIFNNRIASAAEQMGAALIRASFSPNIKERRDCSCALFDARLRLVAQAEHIPVHLGSLPDAVRAAAALNPGPGDAVLLNHPFMGGTHLPDLTVVKPWHWKGRLAAWTASRAHYSDIGGPTPGSIPAHSRCLVEEGVVVAPVRIVRRGEVDRVVLNLLKDNVREPGRFELDLTAQLSAHGIAERNLEEMFSSLGASGWKESVEALLNYAEKRMRAALRGLGRGEAKAVETMETDEGLAEICVALSLKGGGLTADFTGTDPMSGGNLNCPEAVTKAAVYFTARAMVGGDIPVNDGFFRPVKAVVPEGSLLNARWPAAVVGGNVETSQRVVDVVQKAFMKLAPGRVPAMGQGTMNNLSVGNRDFTFYETIGGGSGAGPAGPGRSGVQTGMTNTLNTPIECIETEFPLRVERYEFRKRSGGKGKHRGGDGIVREIRVLDACDVSILSSRRNSAPKGAEGGEDGKPGANFIDGKKVGAKAFVRFGSKGGVVRIETPGGGGFGTPLKGR